MNKTIDILNFLLLLGGLGGVFYFLRRFFFKKGSNHDLEKRLREIQKKASRTKTELSERRAREVEAAVERMHQTSGGSTKPTNDPWPPVEPADELFPLPLEDGFDFEFLLDLKINDDDDKDPHE